MRACVRACVRVVVAVMVFYGHLTNITFHISHRATWRRFARKDSSITWYQVNDL